MKIAIHHTPGSFSDRWINYCLKKGLDFKLVNCYETDIIQQLEDCDALMWHHDHMNYKDALFAKQLLYSVELAGKKTFPDHETCWHFDDKVGQKYLFEAVGVPLVPSYIFYTKEEALKWIEHTSFPKVFKLRGGAGSSNVRLAKSENEAKKLVKKAFGNGFSQFDRFRYFKERIRKYKEGKDSILGAFKGLGRLFITTEFAKMRPKEKGYAYFQDFIPNNDYDIRVIVIGEKAFAIKRMNRKNDFRASGSGNILYEKNNFSLDSIQIAFKIAEKLKSQCTAFDFVFDVNQNPLIVEVSYGFATKGYDPCVGYWDKLLQFHEGSFMPQEWMVELLLK